MPILMKVIVLVFLFATMMSATPTKAGESTNLSFQGVVPARQDVSIVNNGKSKSVEFEVRNTSESSMKLKVRQGRGPASISVIEPSKEPVKTRTKSQGPVFVGFEAP